MTEWGPGSRATLACVVWLGVGACTAGPGLDAPAFAESELAAETHDRDWRMAAGDSSGDGFNAKESRLRPDNVAQLEVKWTFDATAAGGPVAPIHANPVVAKGQTFVGDYGGTFWAIDKHGGLAWSFQTEAPGELFQIFFGDHAPIVGAAVLPAQDDSVVFGDTDGKIYKLDRDSGELLWSLDLDDHDLGGVWGNSLMVEGDTVYVGLASFETLAPYFPGRTCCTHRGAVVALDLATGATRWRYETIDAAWQDDFPQWLIDELGSIETYGPSGADVWSQPTYDAVTDTVYVGTGQLFSRSPDGTGPATHDAVIALDASTGAQKWVAHLSDNVDVFRFLMPFFDGSEYFDKDVADQPKVYELADGTRVVGVGQKSGEYHVIDAATGAVLATHAHADMVTGEGGFQSGGAWDGQHAYEHGVTTAAGAGVPYDGVVMALSPDGSTAEWELARPGSPLFGSVAAANGVVYFQSPVEESLDDPAAPPTWALFAVDAASGGVLARLPFEGARSVNGPAVSRGRIYAAFGNAFAFGLATPTPEGGVVCLGLPDDDDDD